MDASLAAPVSAYLTQLYTRPVRVADMQLFSDGVSNLTYRVWLEGDEKDVVLRLQRERGIFEPYDVLREARVLRCLADGPVPVPAVLAAEGDHALLGAPFVLMEFVEGKHFGELSPSDIPGAFVQYIDAVARIHEAPWTELGLDFLVPQAGSLVEADLAAIDARAHRFGCREAPLVASLRSQLSEPPAEMPPAALCQGDVNVYNYIYDDGRLAAVVDWEQAGIGDRRLDMGLIACLSMLKMGGAVHPRDTQIIGAYEARAGLQLAQLPWFVTLAAYKLTVIHYGWKLHNGTEPWFSLEELERVAGAMSAYDD